MTREVEHKTTTDFTRMPPTDAQFVAKAEVTPPFAVAPRNALTLEPERRAVVFLCAPVGRSGRSRPRPQNLQPPGASRHSVPPHPRPCSQIFQSLRKPRRKEGRSQNSFASADSGQRFGRNLMPGLLDLPVVRIYEGRLRWRPSLIDPVAPENSMRPLLFQKASAAPVITDAVRSACFDAKAKNHWKAEACVEIGPPGAPATGRKGEEDLRQCPPPEGAHRPLKSARALQRLECGGIRESSGQVETGFQPRSTPRLRRVIPYEDLQLCSFCRAGSFPDRLAMR
jgi:hypothetical protein